MAFHNVILLGLAFVLLAFVASAMARLFRGAVRRGPPGMAAPQPELPAGLEQPDKKEARRTAFRAALGIGVILGAFAAVFTGIVLVDRWSDPLAPQKQTQRHFDNDPERIAFLQEFLPVTIPPQATNIRFTHTEDWPTWSVEGSFELGPEAYESFRASLKGLPAAQPNRYAYDLTTPDASGTIELRPRDGQVRFRCSPGPLTD